MVQKIIIICGPTAVGKTQVGIELAHRFNGEIVSADSQQVWRGFDIGTAKANLKERADVRHHLVDIVDPSEKFDAAMFIAAADAAISDIVSRPPASPREPAKGRMARLARLHRQQGGQAWRAGGLVPFVVGGTGMYIRMLDRGLCEAPPQDEEFREELGRRIENVGLLALHEELTKIDPASASNIHPNDKTRIVRAIEIYELTGVQASKFREEHSFGERRYDALKIGLAIERAEIYRRIDARVDRMVEAGLVDEVRSLLSRYDRTCQPFQAVGYKEIVAHVKGEMPLDEAVQLTKRNSRRFAKRQLTWFRSDKEIRWFAPDDRSSIESAVGAFLRG